MLVRAVLPPISLDQRPGLPEMAELFFCQIDPLDRPSSQNLSNTNSPRGPPARRISQLNKWKLNNARKKKSPGGKYVVGALPAFLTHLWPFS